MALFSRIKVWSSGEVLYAADLNNEFNNLLNGFTPSLIEGASANVTAMQAVADPGNVGTESLASNLLGEVQRLRFQLKAFSGEAQWYVPPVTTIKSINTNITPLLNNTVKTDGTDPGKGGLTYLNDSFYILQVTDSAPTTQTRTSAVCSLSTIGRAVEVKVRGKLNSASTDYFGAVNWKTSSAYQTWLVYFELLRSTDAGSNFSVVDRVNTAYGTPYITSGTVGPYAGQYAVNGITLNDYAPAMVSNVPLQYKVRTSVEVVAGVYGTPWSFNFSATQTLLVREF